MSVKKHVAIICHACGGTGAVANVAIHYARELSRYFQVTLISDSFPSRREQDVSYWQLVPWNFAKLRRFAHVPNEIAFTTSAKRSLNIIHEQNPVDIVMCHGHPVATLVAKPFKNKSGIPYTLTTHGDIFDRPKGTYDSRLTWLYQKVTPAAYRFADLMIALSPYMGELAIRGGADPKHVEIIPNGVDLEELGLNDDYIYPKIDDDEGRLELLYIGRLSIEKGVDVLIEACSLLKKSGVDFRLQIVGVGSEKIVLEDRIKSADLTEYIVFLGHVERKKLGILYRAAHIVCVPSLSDPLPTVVLEAMVSGVAVVGTEAGGIPFMIDHGVSGIVCPVGDSVALADALKIFSRDLELAQCMGAAGRQRAVQKFSWTTVGELLAQAIKKIWI